MTYLNRIHCWDSRSLPFVPSDVVSLLVTSPPYNVSIDYLTHDDQMSPAAYSEMLTAVFSEGYRVLKPGGRIAVNVAGGINRAPYEPLNTKIIDILHQIGFVGLSEIIWDKGASVGTSTAWGSFRLPSNPTLRDVHEPIVVGIKPADEVPPPEHPQHITLGVFSRDSFRLPGPGATDLTSEEFVAATKSIWRGLDLPGVLERLMRLYTWVGGRVLVLTDTPLEPQADWSARMRRSIVCMGVEEAVAHREQLAGEPNQLCIVWRSRADSPCLEWDWLAPLLVTGGRLCAVASDPLEMSRWFSALIAGGALMRGVVIWDCHPGQQETIWPMATASAKRTGHPAPFPLELPSNLISRYTLPGEIVMDPFVGSGTTCQAACMLGRNWIGVDVDPTYCELARANLAKIVA